MRTLVPMRLRKRIWAPAAPFLAEPKKLFVIGSGRSGTHWLGYILDSHPQVRATIETPRIFDMVTAMALDPTRKPELFPRVVSLYEREHRKAPGYHYADKSHPNIWLAEELAGALPDAVFLGIQRDPFATVASMLKHDGVAVWHARWREFPVPNAFLGITEPIAASYDGMSMAAKFGLRWRAHANQLSQLEARLGDRLRVVSYERLSRDPSPVIDELGDYLGLDTPFPPVEVKEASLDRWRTELTPEQIADVAEATGVPVPD
jgi:hypothetical protein